MPPGCLVDVHVQHDSLRYLCNVFLVRLSLSGTVIPQAILAYESKVNSTQLNVFCNLDFIHLF